MPRKPPRKARPKPDTCGFTFVRPFRMTFDWDPASKTLPERAEARFRLFSEQLATPVRPIRDRWYATWRAVADTVAQDDIAGVVMALDDARRALWELNEVVTEWSGIADKLGSPHTPPKLIPVANAVPPDRPLLERWLADRREFGGWARAVVDDMSFSRFIARITDRFLDRPDGLAGRAFELLRGVSDGISRAELTARLTAGGVGWLSGMTAAIAAAVVPPAPGYQFRSDELADRRRKDILRMVRRVAGDLDGSHATEFRDRYLPSPSRPTTAVGDPPPWITRHFHRHQRDLLLALWGRAAVTEVELCRRLGHRKQRTAGKNLRRRVNQTNTNLADRRDAIGEGWEIEPTAVGNAAGYRLRRLAD